jgi:hypothetical protein
MCSSVGQPVVVLVQFPNGLSKCRGPKNWKCYCQSTDSCHQVLCAGSGHLHLELLKWLAVTSSTIIILCSVPVE